MRTENEMKKRFRNRLRTLVAGCEVTQREIAGRIGINKNLFNNYLRGSVMPSAYSLCKIAEYFEVTVDWLLGVDKEDA